MTDAPRAALDRVDGFAILTLENPPVNALSFPFRKEISKALEAVRNDTGVKGLVLTCAGRGFIAGADIKEFGQFNRPMLLDLIAQLENLPVPTVAAIHGKALGGGLELALAATFRVAVKGAQVGLPEIKLGLIPGAGGTVRTTYLAGAEAALRLAGAGNPIAVEKAKELGLIDAVFDGDLVGNAVAFLKDRLVCGDVPPPARRRRGEAPAARPEALEAIAAELRRKTRSTVPDLVLASVRNAIKLDFEEAMREERRLFEEAVASPRSAAMRHVFFAERRAAKPAGAAAGVEPRNISKVGVIGAGTMGGGIAMAFANAGYDVVVRETDEEALRKGLERIEANYDRSVVRGSLPEAEAAARRGRIGGTVEIEDLRGCDLIVEAAFEDMEVKKAIFGALDTVARQGAIIATNTSYLDVDEIAHATSRPSDVIGLHFFSPANVMTLLEIVNGAETSPEVLATALDVARRIGKQPVVVGVCHGFVGNRMLAKRNLELTNLILEGAAPEQVDRAFRNLGWPMGPCQMGDLAGLDIGWRMRRARGLSDPLLDRLCELGRFGQKAGKGWHHYGKSGKPQPDPEVMMLIEAMATEQGIERRAIADDEIIERTHGPMIEEGRAILKEGIAARASDIDVVYVHGYGFPRELGGPMYWDEHGRQELKRA